MTAENSTKKCLPSTADFKKMEHHLKSSLDKSKLELIRNMFFATSGLSSTVLVALTQVGAETTALKIATCGSAISAPIAFALALVVEAYLHMGEETYEDYNQLRSTKVYMGLQYAASTPLYVALSVVIYYLWPWAVVPFILMSALGLGYVLYCYARIAGSHGS